MKAVILAGGKGSRLRPLTCNKPTPMVPLLGRPCMAYTLDLLRRTSILDIGVTLQYMPDLIRNTFGDGHEQGVRLRYFEETTPLGTAGSVKNAAGFLDETFVVLSGDSLTDFQLTDAISYHRQKGALATIVLTRVETPLEYGVAITEPDGRIQRFLEKPSWGEVFSDTVNTGIYILEREILDFIPQDQEFDFSKDLFPLLLHQGRELYGYVADGYWSDIGNLIQYRQTQFDMLEGRVHVDIQGQRVSPRVWIGQGVQLADDVVVEEPCYIGRETVLGEGVVVGPYTVIGEGNLLQAGASLKRTVIWNHNYIGEGVELRGATLCTQTCVEQHAACYEGAVIGDACSIGAKAIVKPKVKLWPQKRVQEGVTAHTSLIWGEKVEKHLFGLRGVQGICNVDLTPDFAGKLASAYGATLPFGARIVITCDTDRFSMLIKQAFAAGLHSAGVHTLDGGEVTLPVVRHAVRSRDVQGGVHVRRIDGVGDDRLQIEFFDERGLHLDKGRERKIENAFYQEDFRRADSRQIGSGVACEEMRQEYDSDLLRQVEREEIKRAHFRIVLQHDESVQGEWLQALLADVGCTVYVLESSKSAQGEWQSVVVGGGYHFGVRIESNGEHIALVTETGTLIEDDLLLVLQVLVHFSTGRRQVAVPVTAPTIVEMLAEQFDGQVVRTKANPRSQMEPMQEEPFPILSDGLYTLMRVMGTMAQLGVSLSELVARIPHFHILRYEVPCSWEDKGRVMRLLIEETKSETVELLDGIKVFTESGWTLILPDSEGPMFQVYAQGATQQQAEELAGTFAEKIRDFQV